MRDPRITQVNFMPADREHRRAGLWGWASLVVDDVLRVDAIAVRRTSQGRWALSLPERRDRLGIRHAIVRPLTPEAKRSMETQVLAALRKGAHIP